MCLYHFRHFYAVSKYGNKKVEFLKFLKNLENFVSASLLKAVLYKDFMNKIFDFDQRRPSR